MRCNRNMLNILRLAAVTFLDKVSFSPTSDTTFVKNKPSMFCNLEVKLIVARSSGECIVTLSYWMKAKSHHVPCDIKQFLCVITFTICFDR